jgi:hypothetical protein
MKCKLVRILRHSLFPAAVAVLTVLPLVGCGGPSGPAKEESREVEQPGGVRVQESTEAGQVTMPEGKVDPDITVDIYLKDKAWPGTTLLPDNHIPGKPRIIEVNMEGEIVWEYPVPESLSQFTNPGFDVEELPNGHILYVLPCNGVYEIDRTGKVVWSYLTDKISHDADRLPDGNTLFVYGAMDTEEDAQITEITPAGKVVWSWHAADCFGGPPYADIQDEGWTHTNAVSRLDNGNTLVSLRNFGFVAEIAPDGQVVRTIGEGLLSYQHDPVMLEDGSLLLADHSQPQRAAIIDTQTGEITWQFSMPNQLVRDANCLPNGNILITGASVIAEVTPEKEIVWRMKLNTKFEKEQAAGMGFYKAERVVPLGEYPAVTAVSSGTEVNKTADEKPDEPGVRFVWSAESGSRFEGASVPYVYRLADGRYRLYCGGQGGIISAVSEDGLIFNKENGIRVSAGAQGSRDMITSDPTVVPLGDGRVRMYYKGGDGPGGPGEAVHTVFSAVSSDGLGFEKEGIRIDPLLMPDGGWASVPDAIVLPDGRVRIYYVSNGVDVGHGIVSAVSSDGLKFTREETRLTGFVDPSVIILPDGRYLMLAVAMPNGPVGKLTSDQPGIYSFVSDDGINFSGKSLAFTGDGNIDPAVVATGEWTFRVYYWNMQDNPTVIRSFTGSKR